ncbi:ABC transporter permease [Pseudomonas sp.]|uniref:ABC transporter permease n=1 Tax=Pseudomonas sp. TaxID=306 RepID=UPI0026097799|nr:ABC transporter permease [Pseudomonas sp.]
MRLSDTVPSLSWLQMFVESAESLRALGRRSLLALLGIVVGSASIIALLNIGRNAAEDAMRTFKDMGTDTLVVSFPFSAQKKPPLPLTLDVQQIRREVPGISHVAPITQHSVRLKRGATATDASLIGTTPGLAAIMSLQLRAGRFISVFDQRSTFVVVGARVADDLGVNGTPLRPGDSLQIDHYVYQVIGIARSQASNPLMPIIADESVFIPLEGMQRLRPSAEVGSVLAKVRSDIDLPSTAQALKALLSVQLEGREVDVQIPQQLLEGLKRQTETFAWLLAGLGSISLLVGGVGVMNVMLMNVSERRREIGVRMALGARARDIRTLFLLEATTLSVAGAVLGALLGVAVAYVFTLFSGWQFSLSLSSLPLGIGSSLLIGLFFGLYPAIAASRLSPVVALRDE